jgi:hypothetical protein
VQVRDFEVVDIQPYSIAINYERDGEAITQQLFAKGDALPSSKMVSFARKEAFSVTAAYVQDERIPDRCAAGAGWVQLWMCQQQCDAKLLAAAY